MHPKAEEHARLRAKNQEAEKQMREHLENMTYTHRLRFVHMRRETGISMPGRHDVMGVLPRGGMTLAYQLPSKGRGDIIHVSTALVHDNDAYCKRVGRFRAATAFHAGHNIMLRVPKNMAASHFLKQVFGAALSS